MPLTPKQKKILEFLESFSAENGYAPSQQEIATHFGFSSLGTVQNYLVRLEQQGFLHKEWNARRGTQVLPFLKPTAAPAEAHQEGRTRAPPAGGPFSSHHKGTEVDGVGLVQSLAVCLPLVGRVAAGRPIEAIQTQETLDVPASMLRGGEHFVLRVTGDSMIEDGILSGDYVVIKKQLTANNGETVVALVGNEATIKRYFRRGRKVELHPANPAYQPLIIDSMVENSDLKIEGILVGVIRRMV